MKKNLGFILLFIFHLSFSQTVRNVGEFSSVKVYDKIKLVLIKAEESKLEIMTENANIETVNKNGELKIRMAASKLLQGSQVTVNLYYQGINEIQASQGSTVTAEESLDSNSLSLISNEGSSITLNVDVNSLLVKTNSGGTLNISGFASSQDVVITSGGKYYGKDLQTLSTSVTTNAGGFAEVNVGETVNATTRAGGGIDIYGDPAVRKVKSVIGGKINFK